jgi:hypothetical protein
MCLLYFKPIKRLPEERVIDITLSSAVDTGAAFIKKNSGLKKKQRKFHVFFFKISVRGPKQKLGRGADAPLLSLPPRQFCQFPSHRKSTPLASIA